MSDLGIHAVKFLQPMTCKCGKLLSRSDLDTLYDKIQIVCSACHSSLLEIEVDLPDGDSEWG